MAEMIPFEPEMCNDNAGKWLSNYFINEKPFCDSLHKTAFLIFSIMNGSFDKYANDYDAWFMENNNILYSELSLVAKFLEKDKRILSVGCGSGLFESLLAKDYNIRVLDGIEPSASMAEIAKKRGMDVQIASAEEAEYGSDKYDIIYFNGSPGYINNLDIPLSKSKKALKKGGKLILIDIPKESSFGLIYNLAMSLNTWDHELLNGTKPKSPYPIEFVREANWRTTKEKVFAMEKAGFFNFLFAQTLTCHPHYADDIIEEATDGYKKGDYVAISAHKKL
jgi:SAM-dependent methyltransferase